MYKEDGRTVLNIPVECLQFSPEEASQDKQMVEGLEGKAVHSFFSAFLQILPRLQMQLKGCW